MKKGIIAAVVVVVVAIAAWYAFANKNSNNNSSLYGNNNSSNTQSPANNTNANSQSSSTPEQQGKISIQNMMFTPSQITIAKGGEVTWTNNDSTAHTVTSDTGNELGSGDIQPGSTYSHTFNQTGSFQYHCSIHPSMRGTIVVK
jgi:plastocyanin